MAMKEEVEALLADNNWSLLLDVVDEPIEGKIERYDISGFTFTSDFEIHLPFLAVENLFVHSVKNMDSSPFGNLRVHDEDPLRVCRSLVEWSSVLEKASYAAFVREMCERYDRVLFNDNGVWVKIAFNKPSERSR